MSILRLDAIASKAGSSGFSGTKALDYFGSVSFNWTLPVLFTFSDTSLMSRCELINPPVVRYFICLTPLLGVLLFKFRWKFIVDETACFYWLGKSCKSPGTILSLLDAKPIRFTFFFGPLRGAIDLFCFELLLGGG